MKNRVVVITGGSRGIGAGITKAFAEKGYQIVLNYRNDEAAAKKLIATLAIDEDALLLVKADISVSGDRDDLINTTLEKFGQIDVLVNNAGIVAKNNFLKETETEFDRVINTNLKAPIFLAQACANIMIEKNVAGSIINICAVSAHNPNAPTSYCASKAGLLMATKTMALKLGKYNIRVNNVTPGTIRSEMNRSYWKDNPDAWLEVTKKIPLQRGGEPSELANVVAFLASDESSFVNGAEIAVDGGWLLRPYWDT